VPLGRIAAQYVENYVKGIRAELLKSKKTDALFLATRGAGLGNSAVDALFPRYSKISKLTKHITCHTFRHTCATHLVKHNANLRHVQELLGHKSMQTTPRNMSN